MLFVEHSPRFQSKAYLKCFVFVTKDVCSAATSRCRPTFAKSAYASNLTRHLSQIASVPSKFGLQWFLVSRMPPASAVMLQMSCGEIPSNHWITSSFSYEGAIEEDESSCLPSNSATTKKSLSTVAAPLPCLNVRCGGCNCMRVLALWCLMKCQDERMSTRLCMCHYISLVGILSIQSSASSDFRFSASHAEFRSRPA